MKVYVVIEDGEFKCDVIGVYADRSKALEKKMEAFSNRDIHECEVEE
jgi:hypothetical protein